MRHAPNNNQLVAAGFIAHGHQDAFVRRLNVAYKDRAHRLRHALSEHAPLLTPIPAHSGSALWVNAPRNIDTRLLVKQLYEKGVIPEPGDIFFLGQGRHYTTSELGIPLSRRIASKREFTSLLLILKN